MGITAQQSLRLREALLKLQFKTIDTIEFRSCNLGRNLLALDRFRRFFGAIRAGAPNLHTLFGLNPVMFGPYAMQHHQERHPGKNWETYNFPNAFKTPELVCCFQLNQLQKPEAGGHIAADGPATLNAWIKKYVMPTGEHRSGEMALHGLWIADRVYPADRPGGKPRMLPVLVELDDEQVNTPLGGWGGPSPRRFIPPLSPAYVKHIVYAR
jgi:hypothetical protein